LAQDESLRRIAGAVVEYMGRAFELGFVMALGKLYDKPNKPGLHQLIDTALALPDRFVDAKLECLQQPLRRAVEERMQRARRRLRRGVERHHYHVRRIKKVLGPIRNAQRAHNVPELSQWGGVSRRNLRRWLRYAELLYQRAMITAGESSPPIGDFMPASFTGDVENFLECVRSRSFCAQGSVDV